MAEAAPTALAAMGAPAANTGVPTVAIVPGSQRFIDGDDLVPVLVEVLPPVGVQRMPCDICVVIDISGSMSAEATIQSSSGGNESNGLTLLDIAKHGVRTVAATLGPEDRLSVVWFNHMAGQSFALTKMDDAGRQRANEQLDSIDAGGGTNIWLGLEQGLNSLKADQMGGRMAHVMLLTDGQTTNRGTVMSNLAEYRQKHEQLPGTLSTFGFGYNIDSPLLVDISNFGDATYSFIPDSGFVGTVFVNTLSNLLTTFAKEVFISLETTQCEIKGVQGGYPFEPNAEGGRIKLGTMQYEQMRSVVVMVKLAGADAQLGGNCSFQNETKETKAAEFVEVDVKAQAEEAADKKMTAQWLRCRFIQSINDVTDTLSNMNDDNLKKAQEHVDKFVEVINTSSVTEDAFVKTLKEDAGGQIREAVSRADWYRKWGGHYMPSLVFAHRTQQCNNFKDPGVQGYGGSIFRALQAEADQKFNELPPPKPSARSVRSSAPAAAPASMANYNDRYGG